MDIFFTDHMIPFTISFGIGLLLIIFMMVTGPDFLDFDSDLDSDFQIDAELESDFDGFSAASSFFTILGLDKLPLILWLVGFTMFFGSAGIALQGLVIELTEGPANTWLISGISIVIATMLNRMAAGLVAKYLPKSETEAVDISEFAGQIAVIKTGEAKFDLSAEAAVKDRFGNTHYVFVRPPSPDQSFVSGTPVKLVQQDEQSKVWTAINTD